MRVLFLAVGGTRRRAVTEESAQVMADGGRAVVVIDNADRWRSDSFAPGVDVVDLAQLERRHPPKAAERALLRALPRRIFRTIGRARLASRARAWERGYERRIAPRLEHALTPVHQLLGDLRLRLIRDQLRRGPGTDLLVVGDPPSMPYAARLAKAGAAPARIAYRYDTCARGGV